MGQKVEFEKNFGPKLGNLNIDEISNISDNEILNKLNPIYKLIKITSEDKILDGKDLIGFVGANLDFTCLYVKQANPQKTR